MAITPEMWTPRRHSLRLIGRVKSPIEAIGGGVSATLAKLVSQREA
jgi:hypothetical protein